MILIQISTSRHHLTLNFIESVRDKDIVLLQWNTNTDLHTPYSFRMTLSDLEWLNEIFDDTKHRAAFLRQLSLLSMFW